MKVFLPNKIQKKIEVSIKKDTNIEIRKRKEDSMKRRTNTLLVILLGGNLIGSIKDAYSAIVFLISTGIILIIYVFFETIYIERYEKFTNELILARIKR